MKLRDLFLAMYATVFLGCTAEPTLESATKPAPIAATEETEADPLKLYVFDCGRLLLDSVEMFNIPEGETDVRESVAPCYMIEHPDGRLLWDGGLASSVADVEGWHVVDGFNMRLDETFSDQLARMDLDMGTFDYAAFSHMHFDHVGVANELKGATLIIQRAENAAAFADPVTVPFFDPPLYSSFENAERRIIEGDYDVFGDGRVQVLSAPGHTPGHQMLYVDLADTGPIVLSGDLYHFRVSRENRYVPQFNSDPETTMASMERMEKFISNRNATLWIGHDLALFEQLDKAPKFYN